MDSFVESVESVSGAVQSPLSTSSHLLLWTTVPGSIISAIVAAICPEQGCFSFIQLWPKAARSSFGFVNFSYHGLLFFEGLFY